MLLFYKIKSILSLRMDKEQEKITNKSRNLLKILDGKMPQSFQFLPNKVIILMLYVNQFAIFQSQKETWHFHQKWLLFVVSMSTSQEHQLMIFKVVLLEDQSLKVFSKSEWMLKSDQDIFTKTLMDKSDADLLRVKLLPLRLNKIICCMLYQEGLSLLD